jgi:hypothetical protein
MKGFPGWLNRLLIKATKASLPPFVCGFSNVKLAKKINQQRIAMIMRHGTTKVRTLVYDGSSFDSTQFQHIQAMADNYLINKVGPTIMRRYGLPEDIVSDVIRATTAATMPVRALCKIQGKDQVLYTLDIFGTTYSGHPTKTTWGNTIRTILYACFVHSLKFATQTRRLVYNWTAKGYKTVIDYTQNEASRQAAEDLMFGRDKNLDLSAAGDDVELNGELNTIHNFRENLRYTHADNMDAGVHGLG